MNEDTTQKGDDKPKEETPKVGTPIEGTFTLEVEGKECVLKPLDRNTFKICLGMVAPGMKDPRYVDAGQIILNTCWIKGDESLKDDNSTDPEIVRLNCTACIKACEMIDIMESSLKKN